jgi:hypothetical protein
MTTKAKMTLINSERKTIIIMNTGKILTKDDNKENIRQQHKEKLNDVLLESVFIFFLGGGGGEHKYSKVEKW